MKRFIPLTLVALLASTLSSCELIGGIFKAGMWSGIIIVVIVLAAIIWLATKLFGGGRN